jgi:hypothetical protein
MTPQSVADQLARFVHRDQCTELRALNVGGKGRTFAGWFTGARLFDLARNALALSREASGVYFVPNPIDPAVAARRLNTVSDVRRGFSLTHDADIIDRRFVLVDLDPVRSFRGRPEKDWNDQTAPAHWRELGFALEVARSYVRPFLAELGFPPPVVMCSGNGVHLVYRFQLQPIAGRDPAAALLQTLAARYSCVGLTLDANTYTPARMLKVPGTVARKGIVSVGRPHRTARIIEVPDGWPAPAPVVAPGNDQPRPDDTRPDGRARQDQPGVERRPAAKPADRPALFDGGERPGTAGH